jgi:hypothetical protein
VFQKRRRNPDRNPLILRTRNEQRELFRNEAIESTWASCCGALRYGGTDNAILIRLADLGLAEQCDFLLFSV